MNQIIGIAILSTIVILYAFLFPRLAFGKKWLTIFLVNIIIFSVIGLIVFASILIVYG